MIPKKPLNSKGVDYFSIMEKYIEALNTTIQPTDNQTLWWRGVTKNGKSSFINQALGIDSMRKIPVYMATVSLHFNNEAISVLYTIKYIYLDAWT